MPQRCHWFRRIDRLAYLLGLQYGCSTVSAYLRIWFIPCVCGGDHRAPIQPVVKKLEAASAQMSPQNHPSWHVLAPCQSPGGRGEMHQGVVCQRHPGWGHFQPDNICWTGQRRSSPHTHDLLFGLVNGCQHAVSLRICGKSSFSAYEWRHKNHLLMYSSEIKWEYSTWRLGRTGVRARNEGTFHQQEHSNSNLRGFNSSPLYLKIFFAIFKW